MNTIPTGLAAKSRRSRRAWSSSASPATDSTSPHRRPDRQMKAHLGSPVGMRYHWDMGDYADPPDALVARLRPICLALPDAYEEKAWAGTRWMVRKKTFAH